MPDPVKVVACGFIVYLDIGGGGAVAQGLVDSINPWAQSKAILEAPTLDCLTTTEVGREEQSTLSFTQYLDQQNADMEAVDTNFEDSRDDATIRDVGVQLVSPSYDSDGVSAKTVTMEATCQISSITPEELTPDGFWKRTVTLVRKSDITRTISA